MSQTIVIADIPRCGLGNKMLVWAKALVFAKTHDLPMYTFGWEQISLGPILRGEKSSRYYGGYFKKEGSLLKRASIKRSLKKTAEDQKLIEPDLKAMGDIKFAKYKYVVFNEVPSHEDYFGDIKSHRLLVKTELMAMLHPSIKMQLMKSPSPEAGLHIRLGDFRVPKEGEDFKVTGGIRTPMPYFVKMIKSIREMVGENMPATIFTNGKDQELADILSLPNILIAPKNPDIVDLLLLAKSKIIVTSARSTFGYWSGFLSDVPIVIHPDHILGSIRSGEENQRFFEGPITTPYPHLLVERLRYYKRISETT